MTLKDLVRQDAAILAALSALFVFQSGDCSKNKIFFNKFYFITLTFLRPILLVPFSLQLQDTASIMSIIATGLSTQKARSRKHHIFRMRID